MLEAVVRSSRIHKVLPSQLLDVSQPLKLRGVDNLDQYGVQHNVTMDWVTEHFLQVCNQSLEGSILVQTSLNNWLCVLTSDMLKQYTLA